MNDDLASHDIEELRALMREHHLLPDVPTALLSPTAATGTYSTGTHGSETHVAGTSTAPRPDDHATAASEAMLARILATPRPVALPEHAALAAGGGAAAGASSGRGRRPAGLRRRTALLAVAAATAVVAVVVPQITSPTDAVAGGAPPLTYTLGAPADAWGTSLPSAHDALDDLAEVAGDAPDLPRTGDVQRIDLFSWAGEYDASTGESAVYPTGEQRWLAADGSVRVDQRRADPVTYDGQIDTTSGPSAAGAESSDSMPPGTFDPTAVSDLPTDPDELGAALLAQMPEGLATRPDQDDVILARSVVQQYQFTVVPQDVASGMWSALADHPSVRLVGDTTDRLGRPGVAVAVPDTLDEEVGVEAVLVLIISPTDGQLLGTEQVTLTSPLLDVDEPTVTEFTAITDRAWTAALGD